MRLAVGEESGGLFVVRLGWFVCSIGVQGSLDFKQDGNWRLDQRDGVLEELIYPRNR